MVSRSMLLSNLNKMKNLILTRVTKPILAVLLTITFVFSSCEKYLDVNDDPDSILENPGIFLLPSIEISVSSGIGGMLALHGSLWAQYYNQNNTANQYRTIIDMDIRADEIDQVWTEYYSSALSDIQKLKEYSLATNTYNPRLFLIATVLESYTFQVIFDVYGEAPYSEALLGESAVYNPHFENGQDVYPQLVLAIDNALSLYEEFNPDNSSALADLGSESNDKDYVFGGDMYSWVEFANSLKLKLAMRNLDFDQTWAMSVITPMENAGVNYLSQDAALDIFQAEINKENPLFAQDQNLNTTINLVANRTLSEFLTNNGDPREPLFYKANSAGNNLLDHGDHKATTATNPVNSNRIPILDATRPVYFMTTSEVDFFRSELVVKGLITGDAQALYNSAVQSAFERVGSTDATANTFLGVGDAYEFSSTAADQLRDIGVQKWVAMANVNPYEGFLEVHRMDHPVIMPTTNYNPSPAPGNAGAALYLPKNTVLGTDYIKRYLLSEGESLTNANFPTSQTKSTDRLWWDIN